MHLQTTDSRCKTFFRLIAFNQTRLIPETLHILSDPTRTHWVQSGHVERGQKESGSLWSCLFLPSYQTRSGTEKQKVMVHEQSEGALCVQNDVFTPIDDWIYPEHMTTPG